jgi:hypothetical protein
MRPANVEADFHRIVVLVYTNYRGETKEYRVIPHSTRFGHTEYYPRHQWLMDATDVDRNVTRIFAMANIREWRIPE